MTTSPSEQRRGSNSGQGPITQRLHTYTLPQAWPWARDVVSLLGAPIPLLTVMHGRDLKGERGRWEGGGEARFSSLPASPCALQTRHLCSVLRRKENTSLHVPQAGCMLGQGLLHGVASPGHMTPIVPGSPSPFLPRSPPGHPPEPPHGGPHPTGATLLPQAGHGVPMAVILQGQLRGEPRLLRLVPLCRVGTPGRRQTHNTHSHTHKTNPKSGSVSERINYWLMHIQMRNSAEPGGSSVPGAALGRRIPLERYKSPLPSIASPVERYLLGKTEP